VQPDENAVCGKCGSPLPGELTECPQCYPQPPRKPGSAPVILLVLLILSSLLMVGTSVVNVASVPMGTAKVAAKPPADMRLAAYEAAKQFVMERNPKVRGFSEFDRSPVEQNGNQFTVTISTDDFSVPNSSVRNFFNVEMEFAFGTWKLKQIKQ
jgi:hypothetical protein